MPKLKTLVNEWYFHWIPIPNKYRKENAKMLDSTDVMIRLYDIAADADVSIVELIECAKEQGYIE